MNSSKEIRTKMESIGTYLPSTVVTTRELVASITSRAAPPVEELTGVKERRVYNRTEADFEDSHVLARNAINDCILNLTASIDDVIGLNLVKHTEKSLDPALC